MKLTTQQSGFFMAAQPAQAAQPSRGEPSTHLASRVLDLESALADILGESELSERRPELSFVATQRIGAVARRSLLGAHASDDELAALSDRPPARRSSR